MGVLSSLLSGAGYGTESGNMIDGARPGRDGQFYMALDPSDLPGADPAVVREPFLERHRPGAF